MIFLRKKIIKKIISYILIGNLIIYNFSSLVLGATGVIIYAPSTTTSGSVTATIGSFDESGVVITNNPGGIPDPYTYTFSTNGIFDFELSGDLTTGTVRAEVTRIDTTQPSVTLTGSRSGYTNTGFTLTINFSEEVTGFDMSDIVIGNGTGTNFTTVSGSQYTFDLTPTAEGTVTVDIAADQCTDLAGNNNTIATQFSIIYDTTSSTISFTDTVEAGPILSDTVIATRGDASIMQYKLVTNTGDCNGSETSAYTGDLIFNDESNNGNYICLYAEDAAGNISTLTSDNTLNIDITKPTASIEFSTTGQTNQDVTVTITGFSEAIVGLNATGFTLTGNGDYAFTFQDIAGNTGEATGTVSRIDKTPITGYIEYSTTGRTNSGVIATMTGFNKTGVTVSGGATYLFTDNTGYVFYYQDEAGNTGEATANVTRIDMILPLFSGASSGASYDTGIAITFSDANISGATINGAPYASGDPITNEGTNVFVVSDLAGNSTGATFFIDTTTPTITLNGTSTITLEVFSGYTEDGAVRDDNGLTGVANISGTVDTGTLGTYLVEYRYNDGFHTGTASRTVHIVDTTLPVITLNGSGTITLERTTSYTELGAERSDNYDGTGVVTGIVGMLDEQTSGTYILTYRYTDSSNNTGTTTRTINVIDTIPPAASIEYSITGLTNQDVLATITGFTETITGLNATDFLFTGNGSFVFSFQDVYGNPGSGTATVDRIDKSPVTGIITYDIIGRTSGNVTAEITGFNKTGVTITSSASYVFADNGSYAFTYTDSYGNTGSDTAVVTGIDKTAPIFTDTGTMMVNTGGVMFSGVQIVETGIGIDSVTLNYSGIVNSTGIGSIGLSTGDLANVGGAITGLDDNQTYIYIITATDLLGNTATISGGTFTTLFDYQEKYTNIASILQTANISGNLDQVTNANVNSFSGLYFEQAAGKIEFLAPVDLSDTGTIAFLQDLDTYLFMSGGFIDFIVSNSSTNSGSALQNIQARLTMYLNPALLPNGSVNVDKIVVKDNNGTIISPSSSVISNLNCTGASPQVCTFTTNHFTSFGVKPTLPLVNITSSYSDTGYANIGHLITISFTGSEALTGVAVNIAGHSASVTGGPTDRTATYTMAGSDTDGAIIMSIDFADMFGNAGDTVTGTSDGSRVIFDKINPIITNITSGQLFSGNVTPVFTEVNYSGSVVNFSGADTLYTTTGFTLTGDGYYFITVYDKANNNTGLGFTIDQTAPTANITYAPVSGNWVNTNVIATITGFNEAITGLNTGTNTFTGNGAFTFTYRDLAGNQGITTGTVTWIDKTLPIVGTGIISAGNTGVNGSTGYYNGTITIKATMSDAAAGISGATCEYSTGVSRASATYSGGGGFCSISGLTPTANISVRFRVQDIAGNLNTGGITNYVYDIATPTTTDNANSTTGRIDVTVTLSPSDTGVGLSGTRYCIDTGGTCTPTLSGTSVSVTGAAGAITHKYVRYYSIDKLSNTETTKTSVMINIDKETPILTGTTTFSSNNATNTGYAASGNVITVFFQSHETLTGTPTMVISGGTAGTGTITNIGGNNYSGTYVMKSADAQGPISFNILMTDLVGNTGTVNTTSTIIFDSVAPAGISVTAPTTGSYLKGDPDVYIITRTTGTEANFGPNAIFMEYSITAPFTFGSSINITTGTANDGSHAFMFPNTLNTFAKIRILATDLAGNYAYFTGNQFSIDNTPPTDISITYPGLYLRGSSGYLINRSGGIDANPQSIVLAYTTNGTTFTTICTKTNNEQNCTRTTPVLNSATVQLRATATDEVGMNKQRTTPTFTVDSAAPTAIVFADANSNRRNTNATATGTSTDALAGLRTTGVVYRTDTAFTGDCDGAIATTTPPTFTTEGVRTGYACVADKAGNIRTGQQVYKIDKSAPLLTMPADIITNTGTLVNITVTGDISGISGYARTKLSGTGTITFSTGATIQDPIVTGSGDGLYVLQVVVRDNANNITTGTINFTRSATAPMITTGAITNTTSQTPTFSFTATNSGTLSRSGSCGSATTTATSGSNTITLNALSNATYSSCYVRITDVIGNTGTRYNVPTFTVSYTAPSGGGGGGGGGGGVATCTTGTHLICVSGKYAIKTGYYCAGGLLNTPCGSTATTGTTVVSTTGTELERAIAMMYGHGMTKYNTTKGFQPQNYITREQAAKFFVMFDKNIMGKTPNTGKVATFKDLKISDPSLTTSIIQSFQLSIFNGYPDGYFRVRNNMTQGEGLAVAMRIYLGKKLTETGVSPRYKNYFLKAKELGIIDSSEVIKTYGNTLKREKMAIILYRIYKLKK